MLILGETALYIYKIKLWTDTYQYMHDASRRCPALKLFVSNIFFSLTGGETFSMCFWSDMEGERLESFLNIIYQYTISYQNLNLKDIQ